MQGEIVEMRRRNHGLDIHILVSKFLGLVGASKVVVSRKQDLMSPRVLCLVAYWTSRGARARTRVRACSLDN